MEMYLHVYSMGSFVKIWQPGPFAELWDPEVGVFPGIFLSELSFLKKL